jgi:hypothetical protein
MKNQVKRAAAWIGFRSDCSRAGDETTVKSAKKKRIFAAVTWTKVSASESGRRPEFLYLPGYIAARIKT